MTIKCKVLFKQISRMVRFSLQILFCGWSLLESISIVSGPHAVYRQSDYFCHRLNCLSADMSYYCRTDILTVTLFLVFVVDFGILLFTGLVFGLVFGLTTCLALGFFAVFTEVFRTCLLDFVVEFAFRFGFDFVFIFAILVKQKE